MNKILLVFGKLCSGKGTFATQLATELNYHHITTSQVVKDLFQLQHRSELQQTGSKDTLIAEALINIISKYYDQGIIIDGIRQISIVNAIINQYSSDVKMYWMDVDDETRKQFFNNRKDRKDNITFEQGDIGDSELGLLDLELKYKSQCTLIDWCKPR